eukprot:CAMPEP_0170491898 /NCGR_PEP_ID=MMETSP0208-20121228/11318_1 /TAXON_ID=197538 /ORGANISM="Strombidium inclinatum, Strain S3" /LENGTH=81 /DNA_ID=CAMNT_0010767543 /DNA_START=570 /DNA_END=815 /DNA_ORIENTATION=-
MTTFVPVEQAALNFLRETPVEEDLFVLPQFAKFKHVFHKIPQDLFAKCQESEDGADELSEFLEQAYWECLNYLGNQDHNVE